MFGGENSSNGYYDETWTWDGSNWGLRDVSSRPCARVYPAMAYDERRAVVVLFGGHDSEAYGPEQGHLNDTWEWDGYGWTERFPQVSPPKRFRHSMVYDRVRGVVVMFGGELFNSKKFSDTWEWDGNNWSEVATAISPQARSAACLAYDSRRERSVLFGGATDWVSNCLSDTWLYGYESSTPTEACLSGFDVDRDGLVGPEDPDCWAFTTPLCAPGVSYCAQTGPFCGDGTCGALESCRTCGECGSCQPVCGDFVCDPGETHADCPGDCP